MATIREAGAGGEFPEYGHETIVFSKKKHPHYSSVQGPRRAPSFQQPDDDDDDDDDLTSGSADVSVDMTSRPPTAGRWLLVLCVLTVLWNVTMNVSLPVFAGTMDKVGGDMFALLLYSALCYPLVLAALTLLLKVRFMGWWVFFWGGIVYNYTPQWCWQRYILYYILPFEGQDRGVLWSST